jgi:pimeloyl-ACP methyl ester carboxylesterase
MTTQSPHSWVMGYRARKNGLVGNTYTAEYSMLDLIHKGFITKSEGTDFLARARLNDFCWEMTWPEDFETPDELLETVMKNAHGFVVFVHGWTGNHLIWENLPGMVVTGNRQLVAFTLDHNGFGHSIFNDHTPELDTCNPPAAMNTLQHWINLMNLRRQPGQPMSKVINLVGHSMGGATLFYLNPIHWNYGEVTRYALAPALLLEDELYRTFFTTLGIGISILERLPRLEVFERLIKPTMVRSLCEGASEFVKNTHSCQYDETPRGITGATFMAMGRLKNREIAHTWETFKVMLGHKDRLVGLTGMLDLLAKLEFPVGHIRVVPGSHYMFSVGTETPLNAFIHAQARELVVEDILGLHQQALNMQRKGQKIG